MNKSKYTAKSLRAANQRFFATATAAESVDQMRKSLASLLFNIELESSESTNQDAAVLSRIRDTAQVLRNMLKKRSDQLAGFSLAQAIFDIAARKQRPDLTPAFYADLYHLMLSLQGLGSRKVLDDIHLSAIAEQGRSASIKRSNQLDDLRKIRLGLRVIAHFFVCTGSLEVKRGMLRVFFNETIQAGCKLFLT